MKQIQEEQETARGGGFSRRMNLLWMPVDNVSFVEAAARIIKMCRSPEPVYVVTPNVDHIMRARRDPSFRRIYRDAELSLADGMPVVWASHLLGRPLKAKVSGSDLFVDLCRRAAKEGVRVFLLGGAPGVADRAAEVLTARHPELKVVGTMSPRMAAAGSSPDDAAISAAVSSSRPHLMFVALGSPKQELWMAAHYRELGVPVTIGVGAAFDFVAGVQRRAPVWMQQNGLEWFWRLAREPRRMWKRYLVHDAPFAWHVAGEWLRVRRSQRPRRAA